MERFGPTRRGGPLFRWLGEPLAIDLANTVMVVREGETVDLLSSADELENWLELERPRLGDCGFALPHLAELRNAREDVRGVLAATAGGETLPPAALERVNAASAAAPVALRLQIEADGQSRLTEEPEQLGSLPALLGAIARSALRLVADHERGPLHVCNAPSCGMFFIGRRRWCCAACGNRARAARHYSRTRARAA
jgi:predicted RNA-binding Zn ribbon-like protein